MKKKSKKIWIITGAIVVILIIVVIIIVVIFRKNVADKETIYLAANKEQIKRNNLGPTLEIGNNIITPKSFMVEYPSDVSLVVISDHEAHDLVFSDNAGIEKIHVEPDEFKTINFKAPQPGKYFLNCDTPGHKGKGEVAEMIVSVKSKNQETVSLKNAAPGASMVINNGAIKPNNFSIAAGTTVLLTFTSGDNQAHNITFSDKTLKLIELKSDAPHKKLITFTTPKAGEYSFYCDLPGHEKEIVKMIVK